VDKVRITSINVEHCDKLVEQYWVLRPRSRFTFQHKVDDLCREHGISRKEIEQRVKATTVTIIGPCYACGKQRPIIMRNVLRTEVFEKTRRYKNVSPYLVPVLCGDCHSEWFDQDGKFFLTFTDNGTLLHRGKAVITP
jgi:hypothetical protein